MKKLLYHILTLCFAACLVPGLSTAVYAEDVSRSVPEMRLTDILVSALYFIGVLLLIYLILTLVSRWGKKHPEENSGGKTEKPGEESGSSAQKEEKKGEKSGSSAQKKEKKEEKNE